MSKEISENYYLYNSDNKLMFVSPVLQNVEDYLCNIIGEKETLASITNTENGEKVITITATLKITDKLI